MKLKSTLVTLMAVISLYAFADCTPIDVTWLQLNSSMDMNSTTMSGSANWFYSIYYGAVCQNNKGEARLYTPARNMTGAQNVTLSFNHAIKNANISDMKTQHKLLVTPNFTTMGGSQWTEVEIPFYPKGTSWAFTQVSMQIPSSLMGPNTVFCFLYNVPDAAELTPAWEINSLRLQAYCDNDVHVDLALPDVGGNLKVCAQNLRNYYYNWSSVSESYGLEYNSEAGFREKTRLIVNGLLYINADIYALCEVEAREIVLQQLADSMNARAGVANRYAAVSDDLNWNSGKSGFIYRTDKVVPVGDNTTPSSTNSYKERLRIQAFKELSSQEKFVISMNHFKAQDSSEDTGESIRMTNANDVVNGLSGALSDPDILILGDLNCSPGANPLTVIENAGYEEQILRYNTTAYSHCYNEGGDLIDHAYANSTMAEQVTGAQVFHICSPCNGVNNAAYSYSDHDAVLVGITLEKPATPCTPVSASLIQTPTTSMGGMTRVKISGTYNWSYGTSEPYTSFGLTCKNKGGENWLLTPAYDFSGAQSVTIDFEQAINNANDVASEMTIWVTSDYSTVSGSTWQQLTGVTMPAGTNWNFISTNINIPLNWVGTNTVFGFKYKVDASAEKNPTWEIRHLNVTSTCGGGTDIDDIAVKPAECGKARKVIDGGQLILIMPDGSRYSVTGERLQ